MSNQPHHILADPTASSFAKRRAAEAALRSPDPQDQRALLAALDHPDTYTRRSLLEVAVQLETPELRPFLLASLDASDGNLQRLAVEGLAKHGLAEDIPRLRQISEQGSLSLGLGARRSLAALEERFPPVAAEDETEPQPEAAAEPEVQPAAIEEPEAAPPAQPSAPPQPAFVTTTAKQSAAAPAKLPAAKKPAAPPSLASAAQLVQAPPPQKPLDWQCAKRHRCFFAGQQPAVQQAYEQLQRCAHELPQLEADWLAKLQHDEYLKADTGDDLEAAENAETAAEAKCQQARREIVQAKSRIRSAEGEQSRFGKRIAAFFSGQARERQEGELSEAQEALHQAEQAAAAADQALASAREATLALRSPLQEAQLARQAARRQLDEILASHQAAEQALRDAILAVLESAPNLGERLDALDALDPDERALTDHCQRHLRSAAQQLRRLRSEEASRESRMQGLEDQALHSLDQLGRSIGDGFRSQMSSENLRLAVRVRAQFSEERSLLSGFSNASGSASGEGTVSGSCQIQKLSWSASPDLDQAVSGLREHWQALGHESAVLEHLHNQSLAQEAVLREYADAIRAILAKDFAESGA